MSRGSERRKPPSLTISKPASFKKACSARFSSGEEGVTNVTRFALSACSACSMHSADVITCAPISRLSVWACARAAARPSTKLPAVLLSSTTSQ